MSIDSLGEESSTMGPPLLSPLSRRAADGAISDSTKTEETTNVATQKMLTPRIGNTKANPRLLPLY